MERRALLAALAAFPLAGPAFGQDQRTLTEVSKYLNQLTSVQGRFLQIAGSGNRSGGRYFLRRPGRLRFEYDGGQSLVVADGFNIGVFDKKSNPEVQKYPISQTPLRFLLREQIDLTRENVAQDTGSSGGFTTVTLRDPRKPNDGSMQLRLQNSPPTLTQWTVRERNGRSTTVVLQSIERVSGLNERLFNIEYSARQF
ncbi:MAG: outer membrane lipoprotein carrier protein LolA [Pseudomonadota bacterium]